MVCVFTPRSFLPGLPPPGLVYPRSFLHQIFPTPGFLLQLFSALGLFPSEISLLGLYFSGPFLPVIFLQRYLPPRSFPPQCFPPRSFLTWANCVRTIISTESFRKKLMKFSIASSSIKSPWLFSLKFYCIGCIFSPRPNDKGFAYRG